MNTDPLKRKGTRVALTKKEAAEGLGLELINLSRTWLADGKLVRSELDELRAWLARVPPNSIPALRFIKEEVERCVGDGDVGDRELSKVQKALIRVIPPKERGVAKTARDAASMAEWERLAPEREAARQKWQRASAEKWRALRERYADEWAGEPATDAQLALIRELGGTVPDLASKLEASDTIERLLSARGSAGSSTGCLPLVAVFAVAATAAAFLV